MIDVRSPGEYSGELLHMPDYPQEGALRGGHIPGAQSVPWARAAAEDATFRSRAELEAIYLGEAGLRPDDDVVVYCRIGERSSHTWFVLHPPAGLRARAQLRRVVDRVGEHRPCSHYPRGQPVSTPTLNPRLQEIADDFNAMSGKERLQLLLEFSRSCPPCPTAMPSTTTCWSRCRNASRRCSWPSRSSPTPRFTCSSRRLPEAPTTRGFASILHAGLDGLNADEVLATPGEFTSQLGLQDLVSPLRLRGMAAMLARIKRQIRDQRG